MRHTSKLWLRPLLLAGLMLGALSPVAYAAQTEESADAVLECMRANVPTSVRVQQIELEATDRAGETRIVGGRLYARLEPQEDGGRRVRATLRVDTPDYLAGAAYLVREFEAERSDGMYVFLPSVKRVRRVSAEFADGALLGTNFSYYDFKQIQNAFGDASAKRLPTRSCRIVMSTSSSSRHRVNPYRPTPVCARWLIKRPACPCRSTSSKARRCTSAGASSRRHCVRVVTTGMRRCR